MARTVASLPAGSRITDYISLGVIAKYFPREKVDAVLEQTGRASLRERDLPAHVVVYYVIALALYLRSSYREVLRCLLEGVQWLLNPSASVKVAGKSGISQARSREANQRRLVSAMASDESRRKYAGCGGHEGKRGSIWATRRQSRKRGLSQDPLCGIAGERNPCALGGTSGQVRHR